MSLHVYPVKIFKSDSRSPNLGQESVLLAFCLWCFDCGAVAFSVSYFSFGVLD